ncbi:glycosyltransferase family 2 protein [Microcoleus sp. FACHB-SPT15]|nr:glycosyltransferase family 2 protein [Microcoleus sp. FACHB-SPT15]
MSEDYDPGLVSVIIPSYNRVNFLPETLESVKFQTYRPIELIVIDDGSTDNTKLLIDQWIATSRQDSRFSIRYFYQDNKGAPAARNIGLIESNGEYIQYLDSDDVLHPMKIEIHVAALNLSPKCDYVWSEYKVFKSIEELLFTQYNIEDLLTCETLMVTAEVMKIPNTGWSGLYRRNLCVLTGPWNENLARWQDFEYNVRSAYLRPRSRYISACLHFWRHHGTGRIENLKKSPEGIQKAFDSLDAVKNFLQNNGLDTIYIRNEIVRYYFLIMRQAMKAGTPEQVYAAINGAHEQKLGRNLRLKLNLIKFMFSNFGGGCSLFAFDAYGIIMINLSRILGLFKSSKNKKISRLDSFSS